MVFRIHKAVHTSFTHTLGWARIGFAISRPVFLRALALISLVLLLSSTLQGQMHLDWATLTDNDGSMNGSAHNSTSVKDASDNMYIVTNVDIAGADITSGAYQSTYAGGEDLLIKKFDTNGNLVWSTYFGGSNNEFAMYCRIVNNKLIIAGRTLSTNLPGAPSYSLVDWDVFYTVFDLNGSFQNSLVLDVPGVPVWRGRDQFEVDATYIYQFNGLGKGEFYVSKHQISNLSQVYLNIYKNDSGISEYHPENIVVNNGKLYFAIDDYPTDASHSSGAGELPSVNPIMSPFYNVSDHLYVMKIGATGTIEFATYLGSPNYRFVREGKLFYDDVNNKIVSTYTMYADNGQIDPSFPTTATNFTPSDLGINSTYVLKINDPAYTIDLSEFISAGTYAERAENRHSDAVLLDNGDLVMCTGMLGTDAPLTYDAFLNTNPSPGLKSNGIFKINTNNVLEYGTYYGSGYRDWNYLLSAISNGIDVVFTEEFYGQAKTLNPWPNQVLGNDDFLVGILKENNSFARISPLGAGHPDLSNSPWEPLQGIKWTDKGLAILIAVDDQTGGTWRPAFADAINVANSSDKRLLFSLLDSDYNLKYQTLLSYDLRNTGENWDVNSTSDGFFLNFTGQIRNNLKPVTTDGAYRVLQSSGFENQYTTWLAKLKYCDPVDLDNTIDISNNIICVGSLPNLIVGNLAQPVSLPDLYSRNLTPIPYEWNPDLYIYQWQTSTDGINWTTISGATQKDFQPGELSEDTYFRRGIIANECCDIIEYSDSLLITLTTNSSESAFSDIVEFTCTGSSITLGGPPNPNITNYEWSPANGSCNTGPSCNENVILATSTSQYIIETTDVNGCVNQDTINVLVYGDQTFDLTQCGDEPLLIGDNTLSAIIGTTYSWSPTANLSCTTCAQPFVTLAAGGSAIYTQTINFTDSDGNNCQIEKTFNVSRNENFAPGWGGPDHTVCFGESVIIGPSTIDPDYKYNWSPGYYLSAQYDAPNPEIDFGTVWPIYENPMTYYVSAISSGGSCIYVDTVLVYNVRAEAGEDDCAPRYIGHLQDYTNGEGTFTWTELSTVGGDPWVLDDYNIPRPYIASMPNGGVTTLELAVSWGGTTCLDTVVVRECDCPKPLVETNSPSGCAVANPNGIEFNITNADPNYVYTWSPSSNLNVTSGTTVITTTTAYTVYTVTATQIANPSNFCFATVDAGLSNSSIPGFTALDTLVCNGDMIQIGEPETSGWRYQWESQPSGFTSTNANPFVIPINEETEYYVTVTDGATGCSVIDTASVTIINGVYAQPGEDIVICPGVTITLGEPAVSGVTYLWTSAPAGYTSSLAQIDVTPTEDITYHLTVSDGICMDSESILVTVIDNPSYSMTDDFEICEDKINNYVSGTIYPANEYIWEITNGTIDPNYELTPNYRIRFVPDPGVTLVTIIGTTIFPGGCEAKDTTNVTINPLPTGEITITPIGCDSLELFISGGPFSVISWYVDNTFIGYTNPITRPLSGTSFNIRASVWDVNGKCRANILTTYSRQLIDIPNENITQCPGESITIGIPDDPNYTYEWVSVPPGAYPSTSQITVNPTEDIEYTLIATRISDGCETSGTYSITMLYSQNLPLNQSVSLCENSCTAIGVPAEPNVRYTWYPTTGITDPEASLTEICPSSSGSYTLIANHETTGCISEMLLIVNVFETEGFDVTLTGGEICLGGNNSTQLGIDPVDSNWTYNWSPSFSLDDHTISNPTASPLSSTTYSVTITDTATGCQTTSEIFIPVITCMEICDNGIDDDGDGLIDCADDECLDDSIDLVLTTSTVCEDGSTVVLAGGSPAGGIYSGTGVTGTNFDPGVAGAGTHMITYTYTDTNGCVVSATDDIIVRDQPTVSLILNTDEACSEGTTFNLIGGTPVGGIYSGTGVSGNNFDPSVAGIGIHTITYSYTDAYGCSATATDEITVHDAPTVTLNLPSTEACEASPSITLTGHSPEGGTYSGTGVTGSIFDPSVAGVGTHTITYNYTDANGCEASISDDLTVYALPTVTLTLVNPGACVDETSVTLDGGSPTGGTYSGTTVSGTSFDPSVAGVGTHAITYTYTDDNGCIAEITDELVVHDLPAVSLSLPDVVYCINASAVTLSGGSPSDGTYSGTGVSGGEFDPTVADLGTHEITYTYIDDNGCENLATQEIEVVDLPLVNLVLTNDQACVDQTSLSLEGGTPADGIYSGTGVTDTIFDPSVAGAGTHEITYTYTDGNDCENTATDEIIVDPLPVISLSLPVVDICIDVDSLILGGQDPVGGTFSGMGVIDTVFYPSVAGVGTHTITYTYTDANGCTNTAIEEIEVFDLPVVTFSLPTVGACVLETMVSLSGESPTGGTFSGPGVSGTTFDPSAAGIGIHTITYTYTDANGCENTATDDIEVYDLPTVELELVDDEACVNETSLTLDGGSPPGGVYSGTGVTGTTFDPSAAGAGIQTVTYTYTDANGCANSTTAEITVHAGPTVTLEIPEEQLCISDPSLTLSGHFPGGGTYSGPGVSGTTFDPSAAGIGVHTITYEYTDSNGCPGVATDEITVIDIPTVTLNLTIDVACSSSTLVTLSGESPAGGVFSGPGVTGSSIDPSIAGLGAHTITYTYTDATGCVHTATDIFTISEEPTVDIVLPISETCLNNNTINLAGTPVGGIFSGPGVSGTSFDPSVAGVGVHTITYEYTDSNGCSITATVDITVYDTSECGIDCDGDGVENCSECAPDDPAVTTLIGSACDDGDPDTYNDQYDANCNCIGFACVSPETITGGTVTSTDGSYQCTTFTFTEAAVDINFSITNVDSKLNGSQNTRYQDEVTVSYVDLNSVTTQVGVYTSNQSISISGPATEVIICIQDIYDGSSPALSVTVSDISFCPLCDLSTPVGLNLPETEICSDVAPFTLYGGTPSGGTYSGTGLVDGQFDPSIAGVGMHTITYTYVDANGCDGSAEQDIVVSLTPVADASSNQSICVGEDVQLTGSGEDNYSWSPSTGLSNENIANPIASPSTTTTYTLTVANSDGCTSTDEVVVYVFPCPDDSPCNYLHEFNTASYFGSDGSESWSGASWDESGDNNSSSSGDVQIIGGYLSMENSDSTPPSIQRKLDLTGHSSAVLSMDIATGGVLEDDDVFIIEVFDGTSWITVFTHSGNVSGTINVSFDISAYIDANTEIRISIVSGFAEALEDIKIDNVRIDLDCLCEGIADAGIDLEVCQGDSIQLVATGGVQYEWSPAVSLTDATIANPLAFPTVATNYTVTVTDEEGCTDTDEVSVTVNESLEAGIIAIQQDYCEDGSGEATITILNGSGPFNISWNAIDNSESGSETLDNPGSITLTGLNGNTTYCFFVIDSNGCSVSESP